MVHLMNASEVRGLSALRSCAAQPTTTHQPADGALDHPPAGQHRETRPSQAAWRRCFTCRRCLCGQARHPRQVTAAPAITVSTEAITHRTCSQHPVGGGAVWTPTVVTKTSSNSPRVSTTMWPLRPLTRFPASLSRVAAATGVGCLDRLGVDDPACACALGRYYGTHYGRPQRTGHPRRVTAVTSYSLVKRTFSAVRLTLATRQPASIHARAWTCVPSRSLDHQAE
jgi:hypothetical protein